MTKSCRTVRSERLTSFNRILRGISSDVYLETSFRRMSELSLSARTVRYHTENIYQKLGVRTRTQAMRVALQRGLIEI